MNKKNITSCYVNRNCTFVLSIFHCNSMPVTFCQLCYTLEFLSLPAPPAWPTHRRVFVYLCWICQRRWFSSCQPYFFFISPNNNTFPPFGPRTIYGLVLGEYKIYAKFNNMMYSMFVFFSISRPPAVWRAQKHVHFARFGAKNGGKNAAWMHFVPFVLDVFLLTLGHVEKSGQRKKRRGKTLAVATADGVKENRVSMNMQFKLEIFLWVATWWKKWMNGYWHTPIMDEW